MDFDQFLNQAWTDHAKDSKSVAGRLNEGLSLVEKNDQIPSLAALATHVLGEHLGAWSEGVKYLTSIRRSRHYLANTESERALARSIAVLKLAEGDESEQGTFSQSDWIRVLAIAASALSGQDHIARAQTYFERAVDLAKSAGLAKDDPANRALAVTGNNLACALEEKSDRSALDTDFMILAARAGREFWEIAGGWKEVLWAEYRLAKSYLQSGDAANALNHARAGLALARTSNAGPVELFYIFEALALVARARGDQSEFKTSVQNAQIQFARLEANDKAWCESSLSTLLALGNEAALS